MQAKERAVAARSDRDKDYYENKCSALELQINRLVYELYGLNDEEMAVIEAATPVEHLVVLVKDEA